MTERNWNIVGVLGDIEIIDGDAHGPFTPICRVHERGDGKYWYTTSGDPRKEMVTWSLCEKPNLIATLEAERDAARADANFRTGQLTASRRHCEEATIERDRAVRALTRSGWTLTEGADEWKPPIGTRPDFEEIDRLRDALAEKQGAIDDTFACLDGVAHISKEAIKSMADRLRPHATPSGDRALRLVRKLAGFMHDDGLRAQDFARMNAMNEVIAECDAKEPTDA